ncbi:hypothetical protein [Acinetobacter terrae]|jgi:hypothetical protein|uniref:Uncharacterized protein n=1 Tax=Acinetobacter terrae TaxID=2731247 RepID=A0A4R0EKS6_9GAMM|nr:hypothetical protein [Acinetobacter terrae]OAL88298.1 hypothetical protein AY608_00475 [Acinetobacter terrae]TCB57719.1 hypothetical protein E0H85_12355 [Acinetobacter terrae]
MKKIAIVLAMTASMGASSVYAGFGSLSGLASTLTESATGVSSSNMDLTGFFTQAKATNQMFIESRAALAYVLANKQDAEELKTKLNSFKTTSDVKEKQAIQQEITKLSANVLDASKKDEENTVEQLAALNSEKKQLLLKSMSNFVIAGLSARELVVNSKQVSMSLLSNPTGLSNTGLSLVDAKSLLGDVSGIAKNSTMAIVEYPKLLKKAGIEFKAPESSASKTQEITL